MKQERLHEIVHGFDDLFFDSFSTLKRGEHPSIDDYIFMSKKYVNRLDLDEDTNIELQKYFPKHIAGLYCSTLESKILINQMVRHETENYQTKIGIIFYTALTSILAGSAAYLKTHNPYIATAFVIGTIALGYVTHKAISSKNIVRLSELPGTQEYMGRIMWELEDTLIDMGKITIE